MNMQFIFDPSHLGDEIAYALESKHYNKFRIAVAYARDSGVVTIERSLQQFVNAGGETSIVTGIDQKVTSYQSLVNLLPFTDGGRNLFIHHTNQPNETYHPKVYIFGGKNPVDKIIVGSSNMTKGGFYTNVEASIGIDFCDSSEEKENILKFRDDVENFWGNLVKDSNTVQVTNQNQDGIQFLKQLLTRNFLDDENNLTAYRKSVLLALGGTDQTELSVFGKTNKKHRKKLPSRSTKSTTPLPAQASAITPQTFAMTLSHFDTSSSSSDPVILIPLKALRANTGFWEFPEKYTLSKGTYLQFYVNVFVRGHTNNTQESISRIYFYAQKSEFRLQCEYIKRNGKFGDIMQMTKVPYGYKVSLIQQKTKQYPLIYKKLTSKVSENKQFGYFLD